MKKRRQHYTARGDIIVVFGNFGSFSRAVFWNKEYNEEGKRWFTGMKASAEKYGVKVHGAWVCPIEHVFYIMLESNDFKAVSGFLSPPILTHHNGKISPLITVEETFETVKP